MTREGETEHVKRVVQMLYFKLRILRVSLDRIQMKKKRSHKAGL